MIRGLFIAGMTVIPFTCIPGLKFLGELQSEFSAYIFMAAIGLSVLLTPAGAHQRRSPLADVYGLPTIFTVILTAIFLSFVANFPSIRENAFQGRGGLSKFLTSTIVVLYGFALALLTYHLSGKNDWSKLIVKPLCLSVAICASFSVLEIGGQYNGAIGGVYKALSSVVHGGISPPEWDLRLRSVAFEPPDFANTAGYIWPWLLGAAQFSRGRERLTALFLLIVLSVMIVMSESRTSHVVMSGLLAVFIALRLIYLPMQNRGNPEKNIPLANVVFYLLVPFAFLMIGLYADEIVQAVVTGERVSNLSRLGSMTAAMKMFKENPFFGFGFGQFAFHATDFMPSWGYLSYEIKTWLFTESGFWPATYSIYARFGADMGLLGIAMWIGTWLWLARSVLFATLKHRAETGELPAAAYPLIMSCFCVLFAGIPNDSVRAPMIWINMGLACRYLYEMRRARQKRAELESFHATKQAST